MFSGRSPEKTVSAIPGIISGRSPDRSCFPISLTDTSLISRTDTPNGDLVVPLTGNLLVIRAADEFSTARVTKGTVRPAALCVRAWIGCGLPGRAPCGNCDLSIREKVLEPWCTNRTAPGPAPSPSPAGLPAVRARGVTTPLLRVPESDVTGHGTPPEHPVGILKQSPAWTSNEED
ncbi:hypothetical protein Bbelb_001710 [Branchiostoma belcheri]|nr:hypothetical protein Bbelb_001710 [Branchiostoma belcheri]